MYPLSYNNIFDVDAIYDKNNVTVLFSAVMFKDYTRAAVEIRALCSRASCQ